MSLEARPVMWGVERRWERVGSGWEDGWRWERVWVGSVVVVVDADNVVDENGNDCEDVVVVELCSAATALRLATPALAGPTKFQIKGCCCFCSFLCGLVDFLDGGGLMPSKMFFSYAVEVII